MIDSIVLKKPRIAIRKGRWVVLSSISSGENIDLCMLFAYRLNQRKELEYLLSFPEGGK